MEKEVIITPAQIRGARALLDWSQNQLAKATGISLTTIRDYEKERRGWREDDKEDAGQAVGGLAANSSYLGKRRRDVPAERGQLRARCPHHRQNTQRAPVADQAW